MLKVALCISVVIPKSQLIDPYDSIKKTDEVSKLY
jgi:hypothetical protein